MGPNMTQNDPFCRIALLGLTPWEGPNMTQNRSILTHFGVKYELFSDHFWTQIGHLDKSEGQNPCFQDHTPNMTQIWSF